jgi:hypothetical protein
MENFDNYLKLYRNGFGQDPFGYSASARDKWGIAAMLAGFSVDISKPATSEDLKNPILWMCQAQALSEAAIAILKKEQNFETMPWSVRSICDSQYCAVGLMLVGYSLEICLKSMLIIKNGINGYTSIEKKSRHHRLQELAVFVPNLSEKDLAILKGLTHFVYWAGRYPDPGSGREDDAEEIFALAEKYEISAFDLFQLATRIMKHAKVIVG